MNQEPPPVKITSDEPRWRDEVRDVVEALLDVDSDSATLYLIALAEIINNAEEAHGRVNTKRPVVVEIDRNRRQVVVTDHGGGMDLTYPQQVPDPRQESGRGMHLARAFCPGLTGMRTSDGMVFTLPFP